MNDIKTLTLLRPDDWHLHLRDGDHLAAALPFTARQFARAVVMPNLKLPVTTVELADAYRQRILNALPASMSFQPLMTLYLTNTTTPAEIHKAKASGFIVGCKLYPAGATTHSDAGVTAIEHIYPALEAMQETGLVLQVHGEVTHSDVDVFDRETVFIEQVLTPLTERFPKLKIVFEHVTTRGAVEFVQQARSGVVATLTPQHLLHNRNAIFQGGIRPHYYCLPILKREHDRQALVAAATSDDTRFFLGTDSAPHAQHTKENHCSCAGLFSAHAAIELYAEVFEQAGRLNYLQAFASERGADFYGLPRNTTTIVLERVNWTPPSYYAYGKDHLIPMRAGETISWRLRDASQSGKLSA
ncbi:MAG: dihydroorotase [Steroidobacteraceae bacterium]